MRAEEAGVRVMQTITTKLSRFSEIVKIAEAHENIWCSVGVHPHSAD
ncbi:MAG: TatD family hydrolase, partial [Pseudomonadota bacterium]